MLDRRFVREHADEVRAATERRGIVVDFDRLLDCDLAILELQREREEAQAELDEVRADSTGSQQFAMPRIRDLIQRIQEIDRELEQIELAIELERQLDS